MRTLCHTTSLCSFLLMLFFGTIQAQGSIPEDGYNTSGQLRRQYHTNSTSGHPIRVDGTPDEPVWENVSWSGEFLQYEPSQGASPHEQTQFKIIHDDKYLYFAFRAYDHAPDSIVERLSRRDEFPGDWIEINIDSYHDLRSAFSFTLSVSGVKGDEFISENGNNWDQSWNPIWENATQIDSLGWTAEARIPFSQLRYGNQSDPVWGIQVQRRIFRKEERSVWQYIPHNSGGWVSEFGELHGLKNLPSNTQIELAPYVLAQTEKFKAEPGNPYADGSKKKVSAGIDGKFSVTRDMIVDFTINPDFGQVEADPGAIRLDGYEIFFEERRPFFIENRNLFDYQVTGSLTEAEFDSDLLFYSRRIGGNPHHFPFLADGEYANVPDHTSIIGAAKFSGKTKKGVSIGILESITEATKAQISNGVQEREELIEPLTNYFAGHLIKDFNKGNTIAGIIGTAVNRKNDLSFLHKVAYSGAVDLIHYWKNRWWQLKVNAIFSRVEGSPEALLRTQTDFVHLFQRTDTEKLRVDPSRTSLAGTGGTIKVGKYGGEQNANGGVYKFESGITWRSPGLELNDIGFLYTSNEINHWTWGAYQIQKPFALFRDARFNYNHWVRWDFDGKLLYTQFNTNAHLWLKNNWRVGGGFSYNPHDVSNNALRGTTALRKPPGHGFNAYVQSDSRKWVYATYNISGGHAYQHAVTFFSTSGSLTIQPVDAFVFSVSPGFDRSSRKQDQFVANVDYNGTTRSIVSYVKRQSFSISTRLNYYITPELSVQYYGQPFIFRALYKNFGYVKDPLHKKYDQRFHPFTPEEISITDGVASVDENTDGLTDYQFSTPDLNYIQFRSNLVVRWEYVPGSELFLVWSQGTLPNAYGDLDTPIVESLFDHVFEERPHDIFLVKLSYRFLK